MNDEQIKDILVAMINNGKLCTYESSVNDSADVNTEEIIDTYNKLKDRIGDK